MTTKNITIIDYYQSKDFDKNYDNACCKGAEYTCEICGKKLNPNTMKGVQMITSGHWTDEEGEVISTQDGYESQGFFYVGTDCYKTLIKNIKTNGRTIEAQVEE